MNKTLGVALDIDDTIADSSRACIAQMLEKFGHPRLDSEGLVKEYGYPHLVPEWQLPECVTSRRDFFQSEAFYREIQPWPGIKAHLDELTAMVPVTCYITSRLDHLQTMTQEWLATHNFPTAPVICRHPSIMAKDWKVTYLMQEKIELLGLIDNELYLPVDIEIPFHVWELDHYQKVSPEDRRLEICDSWTQVLQKVAAARNTLKA